MAHLLKLEEFSSARLVLSQEYHEDSGDGPVQGEASESTRLAAYEKGYEAGWDDASVAASQDQTKISTEFSHNLQDLGFTFHEAKSHVIRSMGPLFVSLIETLLPELVAQTIGQRVVEELLPFAETAAETPIQIVIAPASQAALEPLLTGATTCPFEIVTEASLGPGQVYLRSGKIEKRIDLEQAILSITDAVSAIEEGNKEAFAHG